MAVVSIEVTDRDGRKHVLALQRSRLACQIKLGPDCEGMAATLAPAD
jgi:hypothetical protein